LEFCNGGSAKKTSYAPTRRCKDFDDVCIRFDTIPECDGQTDGFAITTLHSTVYIVGMLTRDKNSQTKTDFYTFFLPFDPRTWSRVMWRMLTYLRVEFGDPSLIGSRVIARISTHEHTQITWCAVGN